MSTFDILIVKREEKAKKKYIKTKKLDIYNYWLKHSNICETDLCFDWHDGLEHCWCCGKETSSLERCHIIPHNLGGKDIPSNYVLLCYFCHQEAPNTTNPLDMWDWIKSEKNIFSSFCQNKYLANAYLKFKQTEGKYFHEFLVDVPNAMYIIQKALENHIAPHGVYFNEATYYYAMKNIIQNHVYAKKKDYDYINNMIGEYFCDIDKQ